MRKITVEEVKQRYAAGQPITPVDARSAHAWDESDIKARGAMRLPPDDIENHLGRLERGDYFVAYCT
jgi:hypothetical protein